MTVDFKQLPWQAMRVICDGLSIIDIPKLELRDDAQAHQFLVTYGYDLFEPSHEAQVWKIYEEACEFLETTLCDSEHPFPHPLKDRSLVRDFKQLLLSASGHPESVTGLNANLSLWVCAVLRVMHTLSHLQSDLRLKYLTKVRKQTIHRFEAHVQKEGQGAAETLFLGFERDKIPLVAFEAKEKKIRRSILLKLLHKAENVAQEIYDHIGVRFVTRNRVDALLVIRYLIEHHLISVANLMPLRSRNTLVNLDDFRSLIETAAAGRALDWSQLGALFEEQMGFQSVRGEENPFSSQKYRAIQFTCRPLIRIPVIRKGVRSEMSFFFPMEVQIMDEKSFVESKTGDAQHAAYKEKQIAVVRERILKGIWI